MPVMVNVGVLRMIVIAITMMKALAASVAVLGAQQECVKLMGVVASAVTTKRIARTVSGLDVNGMKNIIVVGRTGILIVLGVPTNPNVLAAPPAIGDHIVVALRLIVTSYLSPTILLELVKPVVVIGLILSGIGTSAVRKADTLPIPLVSGLKYTYESGTLISTNLLSGQTLVSIDSFGYNASSIPSGISLEVQFSQDTTNWYNPAGSAGGWNSLSQGADTIDLFGLGWSGANFYYKMQFTSDGSNSPVLDEISVTATTL